MSSPRSDRLNASRLADHLALEPPHVRMAVMALRRLILKTVPGATEALKFGCLSYYQPEVRFGAIGGSVCMIEIRGDLGAARCVALSFIHGVGLPDPRKLLCGRAKAKRFVPIASVSDPNPAYLAQLVRGAWQAARRRAAEAHVGIDGDPESDLRRGS